MAGRDFALVRQSLLDRVHGLADDVARYVTEAFDAKDTDEAVRLHEAWKHLNNAGRQLAERGP